MGHPGEQPNPYGQSSPYPGQAAPSPYGAPPQAYGQPPQPYGQPSPYPGQPAPSPYGAPPPQGYYPQPQPQTVVYQQAPPQEKKSTGFWEAW
ncbi:hypothetical protein HK097_011167 [Rhizophlyctis rosea]|uniref:Uncharacterized protein n=1 Tax=Rhizophlyctis rosea TaxID=64517 RepID=A0AAD5X569_9FUNG|nr:hypothetical protein HK097_011167 [Rhizophlyctis rosea]